MVNYAIHKIAEARAHIMAGVIRAGKRPEDVIVSSVISCLVSEDRSGADRSPGHEWTGLIHKAR